VKLILKLIFFLFLFQNFSTQSQPKVNAFRRGEELLYSVEYQLGPFWKTMGGVTFKVDTTHFYHHRPAYHFISTGWSLSFYDWFFKVRDVIHSYAVDPDLRSLYSLSNFKEGSLEMRDIYKFVGNKLIYCDIRKSDTLPYKDTLKTKKTYRDPLTSAYYLRNKLRYTKLKINEKIQLPMVITGKLYDLYVRYLGKETIEFSGKTYQTYKFSAKVISGTIFSGGENFYVWVSQDTRKIPIKIHAKILVGSVNVYLKKTKY